MSQVENVEAQLKAARATHGPLVIVEFADEGKTFAFKRLTRAMITDMKKRMGQKPDLALEVSLNACEFCCVVGQNDYSEFAAKYPLAFCGSEDEPGVIDTLMVNARGKATIRVE